MGAQATSFCALETLENTAEKQLGEFSFRQNTRLRPSRSPNKPHNLADA